jgi:hypothetical protein
VVGENLGQIALVFGLQQGVNRTGRECGECLVCRGKDRERPFAFQSINKTSRFDSGDEGRVIL